MNGMVCSPGRPAAGNEPDPKPPQGCDGEVVGRRRRGISGEEEERGERRKETDLAFNLRPR
ncbi:MAG: hypothetical protein ACO38P_08320, partial [Phycisphaerales bacterium]